jgi:hypothetical protein
MKTLLTICSLIVASFCNGQSVGITNTPPSDTKLAEQITGTWTKDTFNVKTFSWTDPVIYTDTISPDGSFSYSFGHKSALVTFQGTWLVKEGEFVMTFTNSYGTGNHGAEPVAGKVERCKIIRVDDHQFTYEIGGHTNTLTR